MPYYLEIKLSGNAVTYYLEIMLSGNAVTYVPTFYVPQFRRYASKKLSLMMTKK